MSLEQLALSDEQVQDIVASLITGGGGSDVLYDDGNDTLTVSLSDSISVNTLEATDSINNADLSTASQDEVIKKASSGSDLTFGTVQTEPNVPGWEEDANSPQTATQTQSFQVTIADTFDLILLHYEFTGGSSGDPLISLRANGETSGYNYVKSDGSTAIGASDWDLTRTAASGQSVAGLIWLTGRFDKKITGSNIGFGAKTSATGVSVPSTSPLDTLTILPNSDSDVEIQIYGKDIGGADI